MTFRGGGPPRGEDPRIDQAHLPDDEEDWTPIVRQPASYGGRRYQNRRGGGGLAGLARFLIFAVVMATIVLAALLTILRPMIRGTVMDWAYNSPSALGLPFVRSLVVEDLGDLLTKAPSTDPAEVEFTVDQGETAGTIATRLQDQGFLTDSRAFIFVAVDRGISDKLESGTFILRRNMTPDQLVTALLQAADLAIDLPFREGLRIEQVVAKLETLPVKMDVSQFYQLAEHPTAAILAAHPWLVLPKGASLEGFLQPAVYHVLPDITPEQLIDKMLDAWYAKVGPERMSVAKSRGLTFYQVLTLASIVEREAIVDSERPTIAGVYQNRLDPKKWPTGLLQADPTVFYGHDSLALRDLPIGRWTEYVFWAPFEQQLKNVVFPADLQGYQSYQVKGLPPGPICTPTIASIDAALEPDTSTGYLFFLAKHDGSNTHAFEKTQAEHDKDLRKYGYIK